MMIYKMKCGCQFNINEDMIAKKGKTLEYYEKNEIVPPLQKIDMSDIPLDCMYVWDMLGKGLTKGVFQLESALGRQWTKKLMPTSIKHLAALGAILRPGVLRSIDTESGFSLTELYCQRKNKMVDVKYLHPCLKPILEETEGILIFQESALKITQVIAGFSLQQADILRNACGKKLPEEMAKVEVMFYEGVKKTNIVSEEQGKEIFGWIKQSQRYAFNACLSPNTIVEEKNKGLITINDLGIGDFVKAPNLEFNEDEFVEVLNTFDNGEKEVFEITMESGKKIVCTLEHKFLCEDGEKRELSEILELGLAIICQRD